MPVGNGGAATLAPLCPATQTRHLGGGSGLINEDEFLGIEIRLFVEPDLARLPYIVAFLFCCMRSLFLNVKSRLLKKLQTVAGQTES